MVRITLPLPADQILIPIEETRGHWRATMRRVTIGAAIRIACETRRITATRRLERQRRGEVPTLAHGYVGITSIITPDIILLHLERSALHRAPASIT